MGGAGGVEDPEPPEVGPGGGEGACVKQAWLAKITDGVR